MALLDWLLVSISTGWRFDTSTNIADITDSSDAAGLKIAVIGAGIAGSSLVSRLSSINSTSTAQVTIFEQEEIAGGRVKSLVHEYGEFGALEGGANYFTLDDWCLLDLINITGVKHGGVDLRDRLPPGHGGPFHRDQSMQLSYCDIQTTEWRKIKDRSWSYGLSFWRARNTIQQVTEKWQAFLNDGDNARSENLTNALDLVTLDSQLLSSGSEYFDRQWISQQYQNDILRPCAKGKTNKHSDESTALESLLAARTLTTTSIRNGNVQLIEQAIRRTSAKVLYNSTVHTITTGQQRAYSVHYSTSSLAESVSEEAEFDIVVIAAPLTDRMELDLGPHSTPDIVPYEPRHVTYFSTRQLLSGARQYDYLDVDDVTDSILTTSHTRDVNIDAIKVSMKCGVHACPPGDELDCDDCGYENIYRVVSHKYISDDGLANLISPLLDCQPYGTPWYCSRIRWVHRFEWPEALPVWQARRPQIPESAEIAPNLFYTSGLEHVVSSMEMSCRMGRHVAEQMKKRI